MKNATAPQASAMTICMVTHSRTGRRVVSREPAHITSRGSASASSRNATAITCHGT
jgi:hypothetical protein